MRLQRTYVWGDVPPGPWLLCLPVPVWTDQAAQPKSQLDSKPEEPSVR